MTSSEIQHADDHLPGAKAKTRSIIVNTCKIVFCIMVVPIMNAQVGRGPVASPSPQPLAMPRDQPFSGLIQLDVDATDAAHAIFRVKETIPVHAGDDLVLLYPEWETTSHAPTASAVELAGLEIEAEKSKVLWRRDSFDVHAFHIDVPKNTHALTVRFEYLPHSSAELRPDMIDVQWQRLLVYPAGWYTRDIVVAPRLRLPSGMHAFTALHEELSQNTAKEFPRHDDNSTLLTFTPETLERVADAPVYAGRYVKQFILNSVAESPVRLDLLADAPKDLAVTPSILNQMKAMIAQAGSVFGPPPFSHYDALVSLSDELSPGGGLEHLEEGENNLPANYFTESSRQLNNRDLIAHEYVHAWNGRYRQPEGLWSPNFNRPVDPSLLWIYEGQTEFWGRVLGARSGLRTFQETLDKLALDAATVTQRSGREWKTLADSTLDPLYMSGQPVVWRDWQRREDYYPEGVLLWLDVDAYLRELSRGRVGLDDFARTFFAVNSHSDTTSLYSFKDVCETLGSLAPADWASFLNAHLSTHSTAEATAGLTRAGWRLIYTSTPSETFLQDEAEVGVLNLDSSIGAEIRENGVVRSVVWNSPAFNAGLRPGLTISMVNGKAYTSAVLLSTISDSINNPIRLRFAESRITNAVITYAGPLRYPHLERIPGTTDHLTPLLRAR